MKKITLIMALVALATAINAQPINVSNAYEQQNRGYYEKAMGFIDQAVKHEATATSPQAWFYRTMIYYKIGGEIEKGTKQGKKLATIAPDWLTQAYVSALTWDQYDTKKEFQEKVSLFVAGIGYSYYSNANAAFKAKDYEKTIAMCDSALTLFGIAKQAGKQYLQPTNQLAGFAAYNSQKMDIAKKYFNYLVRSGFEDDQVYNILFDLYVKDQDTINALKTARNYSSAFPQKFQSDMLLARAYSFSGNYEKSKESMTKALEKATDVNTRAALLCAIGSVYEEANDFTEAEKNYSESINILPKQYLANYNMGKMFYNRALDKRDAANNVDPNDETGLYDKLNDEALALFGQTTQYFENAINFIDGLDEANQASNKNNLKICLGALSKVYLSLNKTDQYKTIKARLDSLN